MGSFPKPPFHTAIFTCQHLLPTSGLLLVLLRHLLLHRAAQANLGTLSGLPVHFSAQSPGSPGILGLRLSLHARAKVQLKAVLSLAARYAVESRQAQLSYRSPSPRADYDKAQKANRVHTWGCCLHVVASACFLLSTRNVADQIYTVTSVPFYTRVPSLTLTVFSDRPCVGRVAIVSRGLKWRHFHVVVMATWMGKRGRDVPC
jgi:hypothetical protein